MSDKKISALTGATTPVAGTEVLPIVQSGVTKKVSIADLTLGRNVGMSNAVLSNGVTVQTSGVNRWIIEKGTSDSLAIYRYNDAGGYAGNPVTIDRVNGHVRLENNLIIGTAGAGIDFSADPSAAGMTSELLDDYEEGTFTCTMTASSSGTITINSGYRTGKYTKIGRQVNVCGFLVIDSVSSPVGAASINGLPFACGPNDSNLSAASFEIRSSAFPAGASVQGRIESNQTGFSVSSFASGTIADAAAYITGGTQITFNLTYFVN